MERPGLTVEVSLGERTYLIQIGTGVLAGCAELLEGAGHRVTQAILIADRQVASYAQTVADGFLARGSDAPVVTVPSGEASKSIDAATRLWQELLAQGADRQTLVVAVGGGVVGDLAGFVAATFARGLRFCQIPTTLLAQVDSSVGGKTGVNLPGAKNMVGAFWQPVFVLIDTDVLETLPAREYRSGLAEVVKYGVIMAPTLFETLEASVPALSAHDPQVLRRVVAECCRLKADVVEADERETSGRRAILNYGHTFAHAFEAVAGYGQLLHGEAVAIGMICASRLAQKLGRISGDLTDRQRRLLTALDLPTQAPRLDVEQLWEVMTRDKKVEHGRLRFVLPARLGQVELVADVDPRLVREVLAECREVVA